MIFIVKYMVNNKEYSMELLGDNEEDIECFWSMFGIGDIISIVQRETPPHTSTYTEL